MPTTEQTKQDCPTSTKDRPQRRKQRILTLEQAKEVLQACQYAVLSTCDDAGHPYGVPVTPIFEGDCLYFHSTGWPGGRKEDNMLMNPNVSLCFVGKATVLPEWYSVDFASAVVTGRAEKIQDENEKRRIMERIVAHYAPGNCAERNGVQFEHRFPLVAVWKVTIENITGRARGAQQWEAGKSLHEVQDIGPSKWLIGIPK